MHPAFAGELQQSGSTRAIASFGLSTLAALLIGFSACVRAASIDFDAATIEDLNRAFKAGTLTSEELVQHCLGRIEAYDDNGPKLNAVLTLNPKALENARALDAERKSKGPRSPLHGVPVLLKDNYDTFDMPTTAGFPDLIVPAGFTTNDLPVGISFFGPAFSEPKLLALGYSFEQAARARRLPKYTPALPNEAITLP